MRRPILSVVLTLAAGLAMAHDDHIGPRNGYVRHVGSVEVELVTEGARVVVYVRDEKTTKDVELPATTSARAVILVRGKTETVMLAPMGATLQGSAKAAVPANAKVALILKIPGRDGIPSTTFDLGKQAGLPRGRAE